MYKSNHIKKKRKKKKKKKKRYTGIFEFRTEWMTYFHDIEDRKDADSKFQNCWYFYIASSTSV